MKNKKMDLQSLNKELAHSGFMLEAFMETAFAETSLSNLEADLLKKVSGGRHQKTNADGSSGTTFIKAGPVTF